MALAEDSDRQGVGAAAPTMVPPPEALPDVLPTDRLLATAMPVRELRDELRRIDDRRNATMGPMAWGQALVTMGVAMWIGHPVAWLVGMVLMGPVHARLAIGMHESAHKLLFTDKRTNDVIGRWVFAYPGFTPLELYRRGHFAHHKEEFGPNEPDLALYNGYPVTRATLRRRLWRDLRGNSGRKNLTVLVKAMIKEEGYGIARKILVSQIVLAVLFSAFGYLIAGPVGLLAYPVFWFGSWMTIWRVINRLRSLAEHGGMEASADRRRTTHHVRQTLLARFWIVPYNTGWHLAHHVDMGVPWRNLPKLHEELVASGWVTDVLTYPNYRSLWRALASRPEEPAAA